MSVQETSKSTPFPLHTAGLDFDEMKKETVDPKCDESISDDELLEIEIQYGKVILEQSRQKMMEEYRLKLFRNVLDGYMPKGKK